MLGCRQPEGDTQGRIIRFSKKSHSRLTASPPHPSAPNINPSSFPRMTSGSYRFCSYRTITSIGSRWTDDELGTLAEL